MEFELFLTIFLIPILFSVTLLKMAKEKKKNKHSKPRLPPGPWKLPLIGNIHQLAFEGLPWQALRDLSKKHGPIMHLKLGQVSTVVVSSPEAAEQILKFHDLNFATRPKLIATDTLFYGRGDVAFAEYGEQWKQLRKVCVIELLSPKRVESFYRIREEEFEDFVRRVSGSTAAVINLTKGFTSCTLNVISRAALGKVITEEDEVLMLVIKEALRLSDGFNVSDLYPSVGFIRYLTGIRVKLEELKLKVDRVLENIIEEHKLRRRSSNSKEEEEEEEDFVDVLLKHQHRPSNTSDDDQFSLTTDNIKAVIMVQNYYLIP